MGCDLLSIFIITIFDNNGKSLDMYHFFVVICFQFLLLRSLTTTLHNSWKLGLLLWFAFNFYYYDLWQQRGLWKSFGSRCCDLLSIFIITIFDNNIVFTKPINWEVVICFQFLLLRSLTTTSLHIAKIGLLLWFAFNFYYYDLWQQLLQQ